MTGDTTMPRLYSGLRVATGTGADRRHMTKAEAEAGCLPEPFTAEEWSRMHRANSDYTRELFVEALDVVKQREQVLALHDGIAALLYPRQP